MVLDCLDFDPTCLISLDFETFYSTKEKYKLRTLTTESYVRDPHFEPLGIGVQVDERDPVWMEIPDFVTWAKSVPWSRVAVAAHNMQFDGFILAHHFGIIPGFYFCTQKMARGWLVNVESKSLRSVMEHYDIGMKGDEVLRADGKRRKDFTPEEFAAYGRYCCVDTRGCYDALQCMLAEGFPEVELWNIDQTIRWFTKPEFELDVPMMEEYAIYEADRKRELLRAICHQANPKLTDAQLLSMTEGDLIAGAKSTLMSNDKLADLLIDLGVEPPMKVSVAKTKTALAADPDAEPVMTWAFAKSDPGMQELLEHDDATIAALATARVAVKSTINETRTKRMLNMASRGAMAVQLNFAAAHTFRWGGAGKMNFQNLERVDKKNPRKGVIRKALRAPKRKKVVVADSAQIEARMLAWLAEDPELLLAFAANRDIYSEFASEIYGRHVDRKANPDDFIAGFVAKCAILGLGYGLGWLKFAQMLLQGMLGGPKVQFTQAEADLLEVNLGKFVDNEKKVVRVEAMPSRLDLEARLIHCAVAEAIVYRWRNKNTKITDFWKVMDVVLEAMEQGEEGTFGPGDCFRTVRHGIVLPSGLTMYYPGLRKSEEGHGYSYLKPFTKERVRLYGGILTENLDQAASRIIVADQMLRIRGKYGKESKLFAHDELVYIEPDEEASQTTSIVIQEMKVSSKWAPGLPLHAEGGWAQTYGEAKPA